MQSLRSHLTSDLQVRLHHTDCRFEKEIHESLSHLYQHYIVKLPCIFCGFTECLIVGFTLHSLIRDTYHNMLVEKLCSLAL